MLGNVLEVAPNLLLCDEDTLKLYVACDHSNLELIEASNIELAHKVWTIGSDREQGREKVLVDDEGLFF